MKNIWIKLASEKNNIGQVNAWLEKAINSDELPYVLYSLFNCVYQQYSSNIVLKVDEDDATQDCVLEMLKFLDDDEPAYRIFDLFTSLFAVIRGKLTTLSVGLNAHENDKNMILSRFHNMLKADGKLN